MASRAVSALATTLLIFAASLAAFAQKPASEPAESDGSAGTGTKPSDTQPPAATGDDAIVPPVRRVFPEPVTLSTDVDAPKDSKSKPKPKKTKGKKAKSAKTSGKRRSRKSSPDKKKSKRH